MKTAKEVKFPRLVELIGEKEAADYLPLIAYIEEENRKWRETKGAKAPDPSDSPAPKDRKKPAKASKPKTKTK